jgi:nucleoside recognition membrane protein YjiH
MELNQQPKKQPVVERKLGTTQMWKFFVYSFIGAFIFFVPITIKAKSSIMLDHIVSFIQLHTSPILPYYALLMIAAGAIYPFISGVWKKSIVNLIFSLFKVLGLFVGIMLVFNFGPAWLFDPSMGPFSLRY